jgi:hypothetical protein
MLDGRPSSPNSLAPLRADSSRRLATATACIRTLTIHSRQHAPAALRPAAFVQIGSMLFITHELPLLRHVSARIAVMYAGEFPLKTHLA